MLCQLNLQKEKKRGKVVLCTLQEVLKLSSSQATKHVVVCLFFDDNIEKSSWKYTPWKLQMRNSMMKRMMEELDEDLKR